MSGFILPNTMAASCDLDALIVGSGLHLMMRSLLAQVCNCQVSPGLLMLTTRSLCSGFLPELLMLMMRGSARLADTHDALIVGPGF